jgi:hypothetical protein
MTPLQQELKRQREEVARLGDYHELPDGTDEYIPPTESEIKSFLLSSQQKTLEKVREMVEGMKKVSCTEFHVPDSEFPWTPCALCGNRKDETPKKTGFDFENDGYNSALTDILSELNKAIGKSYTHN